jgi:hypothetical protein
VEHFKLGEAVALNRLSTGTRRTVVSVAEDGHFVTVRGPIAFYRKVARPRTARAAASCPLAGVSISFARRGPVPAERCEVSPPEKDGTRILHCVDPVHCPAIKAKESAER